MVRSFPFLIGLGTLQVTVLSLAPCIRCEHTPNNTTVFGLMLSAAHTCGACLPPGLVCCWVGRTVTNYLMHPVLHLDLTAVQRQLSEGGAVNRKCNEFKRVTAMVVFVTWMGLLGFALPSWMLAHSTDKGEDVESCWSIGEACP